MKAAYLTGHGGPEKFVYGDLPDPVAGPGEVVVDINAASVNAADWKVRQGSYNSTLKFPYILGRDFSGRVAALGAGVIDFKPGDPVFGVCDAGIEGAYAEKIAIKAAIIAQKPDSLGADRVIDYNAEDFTKAAGPCDVVFDTVGGEVQVRSYQVLKPGGRLVWIAAAPPGFEPVRKDVQVLRPRVARDRPHLERMLELLA